LATVLFSTALAHYTGGVARVEIDAARVVDLVEALGKRFPELQAHIDEMAVAIDDEIHNDAKFMRLKPDSEVQFVPRIAGG